MNYITALSIQLIKKTKEKRFKNARKGNLTMDVKKIFMILIGVVACVIIGALVLNVLLPNATTSMVNAVEGQIFNATGMSFDFNGDGTVGSASTGQAFEEGSGKVTGTDDSHNTSVNGTGAKGSPSR